jgi:hypothetical protein
MLSDLGLILNSDGTVDLHKVAAYGFSISPAHAKTRNSPIPLRRRRIIIAKIDSDLLAELMNKLADARVVLDSALSRLPDTEQSLKESIEATIKEIESSRLKVLKLLLDEDS